jgi:hypothetical protein
MTSRYFKVDSTARSLRAERRQPTAGEQHFQLLDGQDGSILTSKICGKGIDATDEASDAWFPVEIPLGKQSPCPKMPK